MKALPPSRALLLYAVIGIMILYNKGINDGLFPFLALTAGFMVYILYFTTSFKATDDIFEQNNVIVEFKTGIVVINTRPYKASQVTGMNIIRKGNIRTEVSIAMDDLRSPIQKVAFMQYGSAEKFMHRFSTALRKAGGPDFV